MYMYSKVKLLSIKSLVYTSRLVYIVERSMAVLISKRHKVVLKPPEAIQNAAEDDERRDLLRRFEHHISLPPPVVILHSSSTYIVYYHASRYIALGFARFTTTTYFDCPTGHISTNSIRKMALKLLKRCPKYIILMIVWIEN